MKCPVIGGRYHIHRKRDLDISHNVFVLSAETTFAIMAVLCDNLPSIAMVLLVANATRNTAAFSVTALLKLVSGVFGRFVMLWGRGAGWWGR